ncbi:DUF4013 domain-containing protein [Bremerella cremea]|uniref:DUF4013 domain-containing protein n=1 Tax=Bremerella cremea TaxID=1031537 RepID=UPI0031ED2365
MSTSGENPYESPQGESLAPQPVTDSQNVVPLAAIDYMSCLTRVFESPNWIVNSLLLGIAPIVFIIGQMVSFGYLMEMIASRVYGKSEVYPDVDLNRLGPYLTRGAWVFLVFFVAYLCTMPISIIGAVVMIMTQAMRNDVLMVLGMLFYIGMIMLAILINFLAMPPLMLRAGFLVDFSSAFDLAWIRDFARKMWVEMVVGAIVFSLLAWFILMAGLLLFCVGYIPALGVVTLMAANFIAQLYQVFIYRGGQPIPFRESAKL